MSFRADVVRLRASLLREAWWVLLFLLLISATGAASFEKKQQRQLLVVTAVGDITMGTTYPVSLLPPEDGATLFRQVRASLKGDIVFGNLEGPFIEGGTPSKCHEEGGKEDLCYEFRVPPRYAAYLAENGFNAMSVANNHILDFGVEGLRSTLAALDGLGIKAAGCDRVAHLHRAGKRIAIAGFSFSPLPGLASILRLERAAGMVRNLKRENDIVIVSFHGGAEGAKALHVADASETYANEMRGNVLKFARTAVDAGADMVLGHGPHVVRAMEVYKKKLIVYSLGSFLAFGRFNTSGTEGLSVVVKATVDAGTGNFVSGRIIPLKLREGGIPFPDEKGESIRLIRRLTEEDLGSSAILITESGALYPPRPPARKSWLRSLFDRLKKIFERSEL